MTEPVTIVEFDPTDGGKYCGASARTAGGRPCRQVSGYGTDHVGQGRCKFHGGATTITSGRGSRNTSRYGIVTRPRVRDLIEHFERDLDPLNVLPELYLGRALLVDFIERYDVWREAFLAWHASFSEKYAPISEEKRLAFIAVIDEHEIVLREGGDDATETQLANLKLAREYVDRVADPILLTAPKPREVLDVSAAMELAESVTKMVERIEKIRAANAISRTDLVRLMGNLGNSVERHVRMAIPDDAQALTVLKAIRSEWLTLAVA